MDEQKEEARLLPEFRRYVEQSAQLLLNGLVDDISACLTKNDSLLNEFVTTGLNSLVCWIFLLFFVLFSRYGMFSNFEKQKA